ncbi:MAG TPA: 50S ribosomal protein L4 [Candidatus Brocadiales bacterium]|nr:50S ribosomal protein L4 [Candidatus Brocadiales bacterium]
MELPVYNNEGNEIEKVSLDSQRLGGRIRKTLLREAVIMYEANQRVGTASTKTKSEVAGGGRKPWVQKHTGRARAGSIRSPLWRGGGIVFGPKPRDYSYSIPKKAKKVALRSALLSRLVDNEVIVVDKLDFDTPSTKKMAQLLSTLNANGSCLIVIPERIEAIWKSARNIPLVKVMTVSELNAYDVLKKDKVLMTKDALSILC